MTITTSIIIPVFNQWSLTRQCLTSLREHTPGEDYEVLVADNGSDDQTHAQCLPFGRELFGKRFEYLRLDSNFGFGPACNLGAGKSRGELLFFLNNDTILTADWLPPLLEALEADPELGAVGPLLLFPGSGRVQHLGVTFLPGALAHHLYFNFPNSHPLVHKDRRVKALTGAALMIPQTLFRDCGGFHHEYRNGWEDVDLSLEIGKQGYGLRCVPESLVYHLTSQTSGRFTEESQNHSILLRRQGEAMRPDMHLHGLRDGYKPCLTSCLQLYLALDEETQRKLDAMPLDEMNETAIQEVLDAHPFWFKGYDRLASFLEKMQRFDDALRLRHLHGLFQPSREVLLKELVTARRARNQHLMELTLSRLQEIEKRLENMELLTRHAAAVCQRARKWGDAVLEELYSDWLAQPGEANGPS